MDDNALAQLIDLGFDSTMASLAIEQTQGKGLQAAIDFIYSFSEPSKLSSQKSNLGSTPPASQEQPQGIKRSNSKNKSSAFEPQSPQVNKTLKTSIRRSVKESMDSNTSYDNDDSIEYNEDDEDFDEDYYQDVDDYEFDIPIHDALPKSNTVIQADDIITTALKEIEKISSITETTPSAATILLQHFQWNGNKLLERFYEDPDKVIQQSGIKKINEYTTLVNILNEDCMICGDSLDESNGCYLSCKHYACKECWANYLKIKIHEGESIGICCLGFKCPNVVPDEFINKVIPDNYNKFLERLAQTYVEKNPNMRWCPTPNCGNALKAESQTETTAQCSCGFRICFKCNQESHVPADCQQMKTWKKKCEDDSETANWINVNTQDCPKCQSAIEKNGGCNHMTCKKCKHEFCWVCLGNWVGHNKCNTYTKEENANKSDQKKQLERYLFYFHRYNTHEQSKKFETKLRTDAVNSMVDFQNRKDKRWVDVKYIEQSTEVLIQCRRTLKYTYVFGFYLADGPEKNLFEYLQNDLERTTEKLSGLLEKMDESNAMDVKEITNLASTKLHHLLSGVEEGFLGAN